MRADTAEILKALHVLRWWDVEKRFASLTYIGQTDGQTRSDGDDDSNSSRNDKMIDNSVQFTSSLWALSRVTTFRQRFCRTPSVSNPPAR
jgi:hypothetical protein